jgi:hypothetical protein
MTPVSTNSVLSRVRIVRRDNDILWRRNRWTILRFPIAPISVHEKVGKPMLNLGGDRNADGQLPSHPSTERAQDAQGESKFAVYRTKGSLIKYADCSGRR